MTLANYPYLQAAVEENFQWRHIVPAGIHHCTTENDYYKGYMIPKGSVVVSVSSAMQHDRNTFDTPGVFRPERWIGKTQPSNFGYGRRICPDRFIARSSLTIAMARLLWAFNTKSKGGGTVMITEEIFTAGFVSCPKPFEARFESRPQRRKDIIESSYKAAEKNIACLLDEAREKQALSGLSPLAYAMICYGLVDKCNSNTRS